MKGDEFANRLFDLAIASMQGASGRKRARIKPLVEMLPSKHGSNSVPPTA